MDEIDKAISDTPSFKFDGKKIDREGESFLSYKKGVLWLSNPSQKDIEDMLAIANKIGARVRGDEYETYLNTNETYTHDDDIDLIKDGGALARSVKRKTRYKSIIAHICIFCGFILLVVILISIGWVK